MLCNWKTFAIDGDADGVFEDEGTDEVEERTHNQANELTARDLPGGATDIGLTFDAAGNLRFQDISISDLTYRLARFMTSTTLQTLRMTLKAACVRVMVVRASES